MVKSKIKIVCTIGPASENFLVLKKMVKEGMNLARINTKYGSIKEYEKIIKNLRKIDSTEILIDIKDYGKIDWIKKQDFDYIALSFTQSKKDILNLRKKFNKKIKIIAKIETRKGVDNIEEIIKYSDGVMVARGDLGKHVSIEKLPLFQKLIIKHCNKHRKFVITATEMLLSMVKSKIPSRAEASDIANAVLDGSNALMLSEESAIGKHPVLCVKTMRNIIDETEENRELIK